VQISQLADRSVVDYSGQYTILSVSRMRQVLSLVILPQTLAFALVPALCLRKHVPCCQL
jgi:hypothetical protein